MSPPVLVQAGFELEPLAGEAGIEGGGAGDRLGAAEGEPGGLPDGRLGAVGHLDRAIEVVGVDPPGRGAGRVDGVHNSNGSGYTSARVSGGRDLGARQPHVFAGDAGREAVALHQKIAVAVVHRVDAARRRHVGQHTDGEVLGGIVGVGGVQVAGEAAPKSKQSIHISMLREAGVAACAAMTNVSLCAPEAFTRLPVKRLVRSSSADVYCPIPEEENMSEHAIPIVAREAALSRMQKFMTPSPVPSCFPPLVLDSRHQPKTI